MLGSMKGRRAIGVLAGVAVLVGIASVAVVRRGPSEVTDGGRRRTEVAERVEATREPPGRGAPVFDREAPLETRVEALEAEVARLHRELAALRVRSRVEHAPRPASSSRAQSEVREEVTAVLAEEREAEQQRRIDRMQERVAERIDEALVQLSDRGALSTDQRQTIAAAWSAEGEQIGELLAQVRAEGGGFREVREQAREVRRRTDARIEETLTEDQVAVYREVRQEQWPFGRGRDREVEPTPPAP